MQKPIRAIHKTRRPAAGPWVVMTLLALFASGCAPAPMILEHPPYAFANYKSLDAHFDDTWDALMIVLQTFPIETMDREKGEIFTQWMDSEAALHLMRHAVGEPQDSVGLRFGLVIVELAPGVPYAAWVHAGGPADQAGVWPRDIIIEVNGTDPNDIDDLGAFIDGSDALQITVMRGQTVKQFEIRSTEAKFTFTYVPFPSRHRLAFKLVAAGDGRTTVSITNEEEVDFGADSDDDHSRLQRVQSSTIKEWILMQELEAELGL